MKEMVGLMAIAVINANYHFTRQRQTLTPTLQQVLEVVLKFISYNPNFAQFISRNNNLNYLKRMQLDVIGLEFEGKKYGGEMGQKVQQVSYAIIAGVVRHNINADLAEIFGLNHKLDVVLDYQERLLKSDMLQTWRFFQLQISENRAQTLKNRDQINGHIKTTGEILQKMNENMVNNENDTADINRDELNRMKIEIKRDLQNEFLDTLKAQPSPTKPTIGTVDAPDLSFVKSDIKSLQE